MEIKHADDGQKGHFYISDGTHMIAEMAYVWAGPQRIIIEHTEVDSSLKGQGIGKMLLEKTVSFAREKAIKIIPLCPYASSVFEKTNEYNDVL